MISCPKKFEQPKQRQKSKHDQEPVNKGSNPVGLRSQTHTTATPDGRYKWYEMRLHIKHPPRPMHITYVCMSVSYHRVHTFSTMVYRKIQKANRP
ncbi:MAG: hypothetical protein ACQCN6_08620 [Candidatus Bathyarchaeia archaeon]